MEYGLVWEDKVEELDKKDVIPLLRYVPELSLPVLEDKPKNYLIEGDNYHALKALQFTHKGAIDVIYIDPPYNTGNNDFRYNDKFVDSEDGFRHSKWLSFMNKRLKLARELMTDDGVIFVSIDDNEQAQLKLLMDSIFGGSNFIATFSWERSKQGSNLGNHVKKTIEYVHCYAKEKSRAPFLYGKDSDPDADVRLSKRTNAKGILRFPKGTGVRLPDGIYSESKPDSKKQVPIKLLTPIQVKNYKSVNEVVIEGNFIWSQSFLDNELSKGTVAYFKTEGFTPNVFRYNQSDKVLALTTLLSLDSGIGSTQNGTELVAGILGNKFLETKMYPKPVTLIQRLLLSATKDNKNATVLDFFAGSGTTGHAVMELNKEDGGQRSFILCTNNEVSHEIERNYMFDNNLITANTKRAYSTYKKDHADTQGAFDFRKKPDYQALGIARAVTRERIKRVIEGYTTPKGKDITGIPNNFTYLQTHEFPKTFTRKEGATQSGRKLTIAAASARTTRLVRRMSTHEMVL